MKITIKQIAEIAGVHRSTVDKVLHHRIGVSDEVRAKVQRIIDELEYEPNMLGRALQKQQDRLTIAAVLLQVDALEEIKSGVEKALNDYKNFNIELEYYVIKCPNVIEQMKTIDMLTERKVDGMIIMPMYSDEVCQAINRACEAGIAVVNTNADIAESKRICFVGQNMEKAGRVAARLMSEILNEKGKIAIITASNEMFLVTEREKGFKSLIEKQFQEIEIVDTIQIFENPLLAFKDTIDLLKREPDLNGIYITCGCVSDVGRAIKLMDRGQYIKCVSFERYPKIISLMEEGIINFTIGSDLETQGYQPVQILIEYLIYGKKPSQDHITTTINILVNENI